MNENALTTQKTVSDLDLIRQQALAAFADGDNAFTEYADAQGVTDNARLRHNGNTGQWFMGKDPIEHGYQFVFNVMECAHGWMAWKNNKPIDQIWASMLLREPLEMDETKLKDHWDGKPKGKRDKETDGWAYVIKFNVADPNTGITYELTMPADGAYRPSKRLVKQFGQQVKFHPDGKGGFKKPIVEINTESFPSRGGTKYSPVLKIVDWISDDEMAELASEMAEPAEPEKPVTSSTGAQAPKGDTFVQKQEEPTAVPATAAAPRFRRERVGK